MPILDAYSLDVCKKADNIKKRMELFL